MGKIIGYVFVHLPFPDGTYYPTTPYRPFLWNGINGEGQVELVHGEDLSRYNGKNVKLAILDLDKQLCECEWCDTLREICNK